MALVPFPRQPPPGPEDNPPQAGKPAATDHSEGKMSFLEHLDELRRRLLISAGALTIGVLIAFGFIPYIFRFIMEPLTDVLRDGDTLVFTEPTEAFLLNIKMAVLAGLMLATPVLMWQAWLFVAPGLYANEKRLAIPFVGLSTGFFVSGALFAHYLLFPVAWGFFASFTTDYMTFLPRIQPAFSLYAKLVLACGFVFQLPTIVFFLAHVGVVTPGFLIRNIKYAILLIFIFSAILTPTGDPVTLTLMATPMIALYGLSIGIAWLFGRKTKIQS